MNIRGILKLVIGDVVWASSRDGAFGRANRVELRLWSGKAVSIDSNTESIRVRYYNGTDPQLSSDDCSASLWLGDRQVFANMRGTNVIGQYDIGRLRVIAARRDAHIPTNTAVSVAAAAN